MSFLNDDKLHIAPSDKPKKLSNLLRTNKLLAKVRAVPEIGHFRIGCASACVVFGLMGYCFYKKQYEQSIVSSQYHYKLIAQYPINVNKQFTKMNKAIPAPEQFSSWFYRIPEKEFNVIYRMKPAYVTGQFDHNKEILFPREKNGVFGYDIITPFYYYYNFFLDQKDGAKDGSGNVVKKYDVERGAIAVNRGW
jgi:hypothetical protein